MFALESHSLRSFNSTRTLLLYKCNYISINVDNERKHFVSIFIFFASLEYLISTSLIALKRDAFVSMFVYLMCLCMLNVVCLLVPLLHSLASSSLRSSVAGVRLLRMEQAP